MTYGKRFEYDDEEKIQQDILTKRGAEGSTVIGIATAMPYMVKLLKFLGNKKYKLFMEAAEDSYAFESAQIKKHQNPDYDHIFDYIDGFLEKMDERKAKGLPLETFTLPVLRANIGALFGAGSITVFVSMSWVILFLVKHPQYQSRIREEISRVIGSRRPSFEDRLLMPFTVAFIYETLRYRTIIPVNLTRYAAKDVYLNQTFIPRGTSVVINFFSIDHDPNLWTEPDKFMPEQLLLSTDQSKLNIPSYLTPWGVGKRKCIGETLAFVEIFQYLTCLVQRYELSAQGGPNKVSDEIKHGFVSLPLHMPLIVLQSAN